MSQKKPRERRKCGVCDSPFEVQNNKADFNQRWCSKSCATTAAHLRERGEGKRDRRLGWMKPGLAPTKHPTNYDIAWAAGIYEGEGSCRTSRGGVQIHIGQKDEWLCPKLKTLFGGTVAIVQMNGQPFYNWSLSGARARGFLMTIYMFLSPRRQEQVVRAWQ